jgi:hypothetical protein
MGKLLKGKFVKSIIKAIPFVGDIASNILDNNNTPEGKIDKKELPVVVIRMVLLAILVYLAISGKIEWSDAEQAKDFITN